MKQEPCFSWDQETGSAICLLFDKKNTYYGSAVCAPEDYDMMSEKIGCQIAYHRALIQALRSKRDDLKMQYQGLHNYYYTMNYSKYFDEKSYPIQRLKSQMELLKNDINSIKEEIKNEQKILKDYIQSKSEFHSKIRKNREKDKNK